MKDIASNLSLYILHLSFYLLAKIDTVVSANYNVIKF